MVILTVIFGHHVENVGAGANAALEVTDEAVGAVDREVVAGSNTPRTLEPLAGFDRVTARRIGRIARTDMEDRSRPARVEELQNYGSGQRFDRRLNVQPIGKGARRADTFFLRRHADDHVTQRGDEGVDVSTHE